MRILLTGNTGLVGRAAAACLRARGHEVVGLSRSGEHGVAFDLRRPDTADALAAQPRCEVIVHAAAAIRGQPSDIALTNCLGTQQMLDLASRWESTGFVFLSSLPVIGRPLELPITETHSVDPPSAYHASKLYGEHLVGLAARGGRPAASLRLTAPVGPGMPTERILGAFVQRASAGEPLELAGRGGRRQDYVDVRDVAAAITACVERRPSGVLNIASGRSVSNLELAQAVIETLGSDSAIHLSESPDPDEALSWEVSIERAAAVIGYRPAYSLSQTIRDVAAAVRARV